jgi:hypothetical protein
VTDDRPSTPSTAPALVVVLAVLVLLGGVAGGVGVGLGGAAEDAPGEPASFFGSAVEEDGDAIPANTTIVAVVDGKSVDSISVDADGEYGGGETFDDKLRVDSDAGDEVLFRFADSDGPIGGSAELTSGVHETNLTFPADTLEYVRPDAAVDVDPTVVAPGAAITFSGANSTAYDGTDLVAHRWSVERDSETVATFEGDTGTRSFDENGTYGVELVVTDGMNRTDTATATFEVDPAYASDSETDGSDGSTGGSGGGGGGAVSMGGGGGGVASGSDGAADGTSSESGSSDGASNGDSPDSTDGVAPAREPIAAETRQIEDAAPATPGTSVVLDLPIVSEITFESDGVRGEVTVREFDSLSDDTPPLPGDLRVIAASTITVPPEQRDSPAVVRLVIDADRLEPSDPIPSRLTVYRLPDGTDRWQPLPTDGFERSGEVIVEAETPGFSQFVVAGPKTRAVTAPRSALDSIPESVVGSDDTAAGGADTQTASTEASRDGDGGGILRPLGALLALLAIVGVVGRILVPHRRGR